MKNNLYILMMLSIGLIITSCSDDEEVINPDPINNVFTPNGDGKNDEFGFGEIGMKDVEVAIYNRWGEEVYSWEGSDQTWDGKGTNGQDLSEGVYFYVIKALAEDGYFHEKKGTVTLLR